MFKQGHIHTEETKEKMRGPRPSMIGNTNGFQKGYHPTNEFKEGHKGYWKDKKFSEEHREQLSISHEGLLIGPENGRWLGGKSFEPYSPEWTATLRKQIRERDDYICQLTGLYGNCVHHIDYNKKNCKPTNLITLNKSNNSKVNKNRKYWTKYFNNLMKLK